MLKDEEQWQFLPDTHILETKFCMYLYFHLRYQKKMFKNYIVKFTNSHFCFTLIMFGFIQ